MTLVEILKKNKSIIGYKAQGHSGYAEHGSDIVCSSISTSLQMTLIGIQEVLKLDVNFEMKDDGFLKVDLRNLNKEELERCQVLLQTMLLFVRELSKEYPKYVKLVEKEEK